MRIAYDPQIFFIQKFGGVSRYFVELAKGMKECGEEAAIFAPLGWNSHLEFAKFSVFQASRLAEIYSKLPQRITRGRYLYDFFGVRPEIRARISKWKPDVVHETYYYPKRLGPRGIPTVLTVYDMIHEIMPDHFELSNPTRVHKKKAIANADAIICISHSTARDLHELLGVPYSKISVIHLGCDFPATLNISNAEHSTREKPYLLYVGARSGYKNFAGFIEAFAASESLKSDFDLIAFGGGSFTEDETVTIRDFGLATVVRHVSGDDRVLANLYANAHAFVYPSNYEGFGLPPLEAMAHGCPVISSNTSSMPEVIGEAGCFFDPNSIESITEALIDVSYNDSARSQLIAKGTERVRLFSWQSCAAETLQVYRALL